VSVQSEEVGSGAGCEQEVPGPDVPGRRGPRGRCAPPTHTNTEDTVGVEEGVAGISQLRCVTYQVDAVPPVDGHQRRARIVQLPHLQQQIAIANDA
jgi:hypothetical protein